MGGSAAESNKLAEIPGGGSPHNRPENLCIYFNTWDSMIKPREFDPQSPEEYHPNVPSPGQFSSQQDGVDWDRAEAYLRYLFETYPRQIVSSMDHLNQTILPLMKKVHDGERSRGLFKEIRGISSTLRNQGDEDSQQSVH